MAEDIKSNITGLDIILDNSNANEIDTNYTLGDEVINPKDIALAISNTPDDTLDPEEEKEDEIESKKEDTNKEEKADKEDKEEKADVSSNNITDTPEEGDPETFKVLGEYFSNEGILEGFDEEMENTPEAFQQMIESTVNKQVQDYKDNLKSPIAKQFLDYIDNGGDPGQFLQLVSGPDYSQVTPEQIGENDAAQKEVLRAYYAGQGESAEDIEDTIQAFEDAGNLSKRANVALGKLQKSQSEHRKKEIENQAKAKQRKAEEVQTYIDEFKSDIDSRKELGGFQLTKKTKKDLFDYVTKIDPKTGKTKMFEDSQDPEKQLLMTFMYFNNFNFDKLEKKVKSDATKDLMSKLHRTSDTGTKQKSTKRTPANKNEPGNVNLSVLKKLFK